MDVNGVDDADTFEIRFSSTYDGINGGDDSSKKSRKDAIFFEADEYKPVDASTGPLLVII